VLDHQADEATVTRTFAGAPQVRPGWRRTTRGFLLALAFSILPASAFAASPEGEWWVHDKQARITIADCAGALWGVISWEAKPGMDQHNPDPAKRGRPMRGLPIILGMKSSGPSKWTGQIYNSAFGQTVSGGVALPADDTLRITGCILGFLCGGENWTRATDVLAASTSFTGEAICKSVSGK
jgi:uncharacterized protein (DUF2147 family)